MIKKFLAGAVKAYKRDPVFAILLVTIIFLALFFRTYHYSDRIFIESDNTRDAQVSVYAAHNFKIPQTGQFSSAGPFFYSPWWYIFLTLISFIPLGAFTPWYGLTIVSFLYLVELFYVGKRLGNKWTGLLAVLFGSISAPHINNSLSIWNPVIIPFLSLIAIHLLFKAYVNESLKKRFFLGLVLGLACSIHFQSILLLPLLVVSFFMKKPRLKSIVSTIIGFCIPFIPLLYWDIRHKWWNLRNVINYLLVDQYKIWVPNRWLFYMRDYWPKTWASIVGGFSWVAVLVVLTLIFLAVKNIMKVKKNVNFYLLLTCFIGELILYRYYRGERYVYYSYFAHPAILLLTAWTVWQLRVLNKLIGTLFILLVFLFTFQNAIQNITEEKIKYSTIERIKNEIYTKAPANSYDIYGCLFNGNLAGYPVAYFLYRDGRNALNGRKIGICATSDKDISWTVLSDESVGKQNSAWMQRTTAYVYTETVEWWMTSPPK